MSWGNPKTLSDKLGVKVLTPLTILYGSLLQLHRWSYKKKFFRSRKLSCPVVSVGNLTVGGTGKTPIIIDLANRLLAENIKVGILSRGYKRKNSLSMTVVSDGQGNFASVADSGDEPLMMAKILPQAVVIVGKDRYQAGQKAIKEYGCQVLLLDDGFQHWKLERDYNIVLLDYNDEIWHDNLLPAGRLREPLNALKRADHVVITKIPKVFHADQIDKFKKLVFEYSPNCIISLAQFEAQSLHQLITGKWTDVPIEKLRDLPTIAFCGLAKSQGFFELAKYMGANLLKEIKFSDHHNYTNDDVETLKNELHQTKAEYLVTTRKDLIKLENSDLSSRILAINLTTKWIKGMPDINDFIRRSAVLDKVLN
jgi:tetraacyldisaccharide 4'-kinase